MVRSRFTGGGTNIINVSITMRRRKAEGREPSYYYQRPDHIRVVKAVCVEFGNNDDTWTWCYLDVREALTKAKELLMKLEPEERLIVGTAYCGQNLRTGEILELVPSEDDLEIGGVKYGDYKEELLRIEPADFSSWPEGTPEHIFGDV